MGDWEIDRKDLEVPVFEPRTPRLAVCSHDHYTFQYCMKGHAKFVHVSFSFLFLVVLNPFLVLF